MIYFGGAAAALQRGYTCLTFEGPGQGATIRLQRIPFRHDWENVITPVVDDLHTRPEVDKQRIALMGISLGGLWALRAAAYEHRLAACIANDGLFTFQSGEMAPEGVTMDFNEPGKLETFIQELMANNTGVRWTVDNGGSRFRRKHSWS